MARLKPIPDEVDLVVVPGGYERGAALVSAYLKERRKRPGYEERVKALFRLIKRKEREAAKYQAKQREAKVRGVGKASSDR